MNRRPAGHGTIEPLSSGRHRARIPLPDGQRHTVGVFDTPDEAAAALDAVVLEQIESGVEWVGGATISGALPRFLDDTERTKSYAAMPNLRSIARCWLETAPFADWPVRQVTRHAVQRWVNRMAKAPVAPASITQRLSALRKFFEWAVAERIVDESPARDVTVPRGLSSTEEAWTYLTLDEQRRIVDCPAIPEMWRLHIEIAMLTGIREGEHFALRLPDVHTGDDPRIVVRYGSRRRGPKGRKIRIVPLTPDAIVAVERWLELLPEYCPRNEHRLFFPGARGGFRKVSRIVADKTDGAEPSGWHDWLRAAGIERDVRWHDLRHTCGASLVSGWWGRAWSLHEVRDLLGHWSVKETERYAHLAPEALRKAAAETTTRSPRGAHALLKTPEDTGTCRITGVDDGGSAQTQGFREVIPPFGPAVGSVAVALLRAVAAGESVDGLRVQLGAAVLGSPLIRLATESIGDGPHALDRAIELARSLLPVAEQGKGMASG